MIENFSTEHNTVIIQKYYEQKRSLCYPQALVSINPGSSKIRIPGISESTKIVDIFF